MVEGWAALLAINGSYNPRNGLINGFSWGHITLPYGEL